MASITKAGDYCEIVSIFQQIKQIEQIFLLVNEILNCKAKTIYRSAHRERNESHRISAHSVLTAVKIPCIEFKIRLMIPEPADWLS